jgi:hypothetical protein
MLLFAGQIWAQGESTLSPFAAEYGPKSACVTQNKAKRANKIVFLLLVRDQEVDGSNPFAPTTSLWSGPETWVTDCTGDMGNT